ncbi:MAG TPA: hypothetical protein PLV92_18485, partial [Pirellulaceae bacterium]|nr:hypothetical protein [Pirellulaceae bacterium]
DTPHAVINNILNSEPRPPRAVRSSIPRDLETIILKCLAKEPAQRYDSARQLADDLRAFLEQRPLVARRAGLVERSVRWLRRQRRSVLLAASVTAATLLTVVVGAAGWWKYDKWRQASLALTTTSPPLVAELLDADDNVLRIETVPTQSPIDVPRGDYKLRVSGDGVLSRTFDVQLVRGEVTKVDLDLGHTLIGAPQTIARGFATASDGPGDRPTTGTIFEFTPTGVRAIGGTPLRTRWSTDLVAHGQKSSLNLAMPPLLTTVHSGNEPFDLRPWVVSQARDLDRDGLNDYVIAARHQAWVAALSGRDGRVLWCAARTDDVTKEGPSVDQWPHSRPVSGVLDPPEWLDDINGDGAPDLVAQFIDIVRPGVVKGSVCAARRWVEAFSGASGETIWRHELAAAPFALPAGSVVPDELHWWVGASFGESSGGASTAMFRRHYSRDLGLNQRSGLHAYRPAPLARVRHAGQARLAIVGGSFLTLLDPANGRVADGSRALGFHASRPPQWGDLDGDGNDDLVAVVDAKQWQIMLESQRVAKLNERLDKKLNEESGEERDEKLDAKPDEKPDEKPSSEPASVATPSSPDADDLLGMDIAAPTAPFATYAGTRVVAWSPATGKPLWECDLEASIPERVNWSVPLPRWPLVV